MRKQPLYKPESWLILDHKACYKHIYHAGGDQEGIFSVVRDKVVPTAEFAFAKFIERYLEPALAEYAPRQIIVAHDMGIKYRQNLLPEYKQKRGERERCEIEDEQMERMHKLLVELYKRMGIMQVGVDGVEADDVIAYLCGNLKGIKQVRTVDADLLALVNEDTIVNLKEDCYTDDDWYKDTFPLNSAENCISISKAMLGDTSDGYKGVPGFGPAKWDELVEAVGYDGVKEIEAAVEARDVEPVKAAAELTGLKSLQLLVNNWDEFRRQWQVAKLHPELCWKPAGKKLPKLLWTRRVASRVKVQELLASVNCLDLFSVFEPFLPVAYLLTQKEYDPDFIAAIKNEILKSPFVAFDYESWDDQQFECYRLNDPDYVDVLSQKLTGGVLTFGQNLESSVYVSVGHKSERNLPVSTLLDLVMFAYENKPLVAHNAMFEMTVTKTNTGIELEGLYDTNIMSSYVDENSRSGLKYLSKSILNYDQVSYGDTLAAAGVSNMAELTPEQVFNYGVDDGVVTAYLFDFMHMILQLEGTIDFYEQNELYTANVLMQAFMEGVVMDTELMSQIREDDERVSREAIERIRAILSEHCQDGPGLDYSGVEGLIEAERPIQKKLLRAKYKKQAEAGKNLDTDQAFWIRQQTEGALQRWETKLQAAVPYVPYGRDEIPVVFAPTVKQFETVTTALGLDPLEKVTQAAISEWLARHSVNFETDEVVMLTPKQQKFVTLLGAASKQLNKREGEAYEQLCQFCAGFFPPKISEYGDELSLNSPNQMQELLYCKLALPLRLRTKAQAGSARMTLGLEGSPGTDDKVIKMALANDCEGEHEWKAEVLNLILEAKAALTRLGLYHKPYPNWVRPTDGRIHPSVRNCGTVTRRPAGGAPNILQVSKGETRRDSGLRMRSLFLPPHPDYVAVPIDYSGQELRIMACQTMDTNLLSVYGVTRTEHGTYFHSTDNEKDLHGMTASGIIGVDYETFIEAYNDEGHANHKDYSKVRGKKAKGTNFGLSYGAGAETLSRNLTVPVEEAEQLLSAAHATYPGIGMWQERSADFARTYGFTQTAFGTRRHMTDDIFSKEAGKRSRMERQGANFEIQGTAADMLKKVLTGIWQRGLIQRLRMVFFAPIYDEVVSWVHVDDVWDYCVEMNEIMSGATPPGHVVPQVPEFSVGPDWGKVKELGRLPEREVIEQAARAAWEENQQRLHLWERNTNRAA